MEKRGSSPALTNYKDKKILATGGESPWNMCEISEHRITLACAEVYSVASDYWSIIPEMNVARSAHGSCTVANYVYVACGSYKIITCPQYDNYDYCIRNLQSIERINMNDIYGGWEELHVATGENLSRRNSIFMAGLSCDELLIIGGNNSKDLG